MATVAGPELSQFACDVAQGLLQGGQKRISPRYFYDDIGSALFEAITLIPEYGLTRADESLLRAHSPEIAAAGRGVGLIAELGSGSGRKTTHILRAFGRTGGPMTYRPIDVSEAALVACERELHGLARIEPVLGDWMDGLGRVSASRVGDDPLLLLFLGSSIGNLERVDLVPFLIQIRSHLRPGDFILLGADLVKDVEVMVKAYDDPTGVTAAFNLNLLGRMNRELRADFDLRSFVHEIRWDADQRRIEMHLLSCRDQDVYIAELNKTVHLCAGETIWTESSHKFTEQELETLAVESGYQPLTTWKDESWPFVEALWKV